MLLLSELWAGTPRRIPRPDYLLYALQRRQRKSAYSSVSSPVSGSTTIWPSVTQPSLQAWGHSSWPSWWGAAVKGSPAGGILLMSTVASHSCLLKWLWAGLRGALTPAEPLVFLTRILGCFDLEVNTLLCYLAR